MTRELVLCLRVEELRQFTPGLIPLNPVVYLCPDPLHRWLMILEDHNFPRSGLLPHEYEHPGKTLLRMRKEREDQVMRLFISGCSIVAAIHKVYSERGLLTK